MLKQCGPIFYPPPPMTNSHTNHSNSSSLPQIADRKSLHSLYRALTRALPSGPDLALVIELPAYTACIFLLSLRSPLIAELSVSRPPTMDHCLLAIYVPNCRLKVPTPRSVCVVWRVLVLKLLRTVGCCEDECMYACTYVCLCVCVCVCMCESVCLNYPKGSL